MQIAPGADQQRIHFSPSGESGDIAVKIHIAFILRKFLPNPFFIRVDNSAKTEFRVHFLQYLIDPACSQAESDDTDLDHCNHLIYWLQEQSCPILFYH